MSGQAAERGSFLETLRDRLTAGLDAARLSDDPAVATVLLAKAIEPVEALLSTGPKNPAFLRKLAWSGLMRAIAEHRQALPDSAPSAAWDVLHAGVMALPGDRRTAALLALQGHSSDEAAELLEWSPRQAKNLFSGAWETLKAAGAFGSEVAEHESARWSAGRRLWRNAPIRSGMVANTEDLWLAVHGDLEPQDTRMLIEQLGEEPLFAEAWRIAWAVEPSVVREPMMARSPSEEIFTSGEPADPSSNPSLEVDGSGNVSVRRSRKRRSSPATEPVVIASPSGPPPRGPVPEPVAPIVTAPAPEPSPPYSTVKALALLIAVIAAALVVVWWWMPGADPALISLVTEGGTLPRNAVLLKWTGGPPDASYDIVVLDENLSQVEKANDLTQPQYRVDPTDLQALPDGGVLLWSVRAQGKNGAVTQSDTYTLHVGAARP